MKKIALNLELTDVLKMLVFYDFMLDTLEYNDANMILMRNVLIRVQHETMKQTVKQVTPQELADAIIANENHFITVS